MSHFLRIANLQMINVMNENIFICVLSVFCLILVFFLFLEKRNSKGIIHAVIFSLYTLPLYYLMFFRGAGGAAKRTSWKCGEMAERASTHSYCKKTPRFAEKGGADETGHCIFAEAGHYNRRNGIKKGAVIQFLFRIHRYLFD